MATLLSDVLYAFRLFAKKPFTTLAVILSLGLGIGLNTAIFIFLNQLLLHPLPGVKSLSSLVTIYSQQNSAGYYFPISFPNYKDISRQQTIFSQLGAYQLVRVGLAGRGEAEQITGEMVSANFFSLLGIKMAMGRDFSPTEDEISGSSPVVILSQELWQRYFASDPNIIGRKLLLNGSPFTVLGVAPADFRGTNSISAAEFWVPFSTYRTVLFYPEFFEQRSSQSLQLLGRLKRGQTFAAAEAQMRTIAKRLERDYLSDNRGQTFALMPMTQASIPPDQRPVYARAGALLIAIAGLMLLLACINIANLILAKTLARGPEFAIRLSVGADKLRLARQLLTENLLLSFLAGAFALLVARWGRDILWRFRPPNFTAEAPHLFDWRILAFTLALTLLTGLLFGVAPILIAARSDLVSPLKQEEKQLRFYGSKLYTSNVLIFVQAALSSVCLASAGFCILSLYNAVHTNPGFSVRQLLTVSFDLQFRGYNESQGYSFYNGLLPRLKALPGVESAALAENRLLGGFRLWRGVTLPGHAATEERLQVGSTIIDPEYFMTVGIPLLRGRSFSDRDRKTAVPVIVVNEAMAHMFWPSGEALGEHIQLDDEKIPVEIIGVVGNSKYQSLKENPQPFIYLPLLQRYTSKATLHLRTHGDPGALEQSVRQTIQAIDPSLPLVVRTLPELLEQSLWIPRLIAALLTVFSVIALLLAGVGVYGITSHSVNQRRFEISMRMALGAQRPSIIRLLIARGMMALGLGVLGGILSSFPLRKLLSTLVYEGHVSESFVLLSIIPILTAVGLLACLVPTVRATRENPAAALREK